MDTTTAPRRTPASPAAPQVVFVLILLFWLFAGPNDQSAQANVGFAQQFRVGEVLSQQDLWKQRIRNLRDQLDVLRNGTYAPYESGEVPSYWNLTGLREKDGYAWDVLDDVKERAKKIGENAIGIIPAAISRRDSRQDDKLAADTEEVVIPTGVKKEYAPKSFYQNATGTVRGNWVRSKMFSQRVEEELRHTRERGLNLSALAPDTNWSGWDVKRNITGREGKLRLAIEDDGREIEGHWNNITGGFILILVNDTKD